MLTVALMMTIEYDIDKFIGLRQIVALMPSLDMVR